MCGLSVYILRAKKLEETRETGRRARDRSRENIEGFFFFSLSSTAHTGEPFICRETFLCGRCKIKSPFFFFFFHRRPEAIHDSHLYAPGLLQGCACGTCNTAAAPLYSISLYVLRREKNDFSFSHIFNSHIVKAFYNGELSLYYIALYSVCGERGYSSRK